MTKFKELTMYNELNDFLSNNERIGILDSDIIKYKLELEYVWMIQLFKRAESGKNVYSLMITMEDESEYIVEFDLIDNKWIKNDINNIK